MGWNCFKMSPKCKQIYGVWCVLFIFETYRFLLLRFRTIPRNSERKIEIFVFFLLFIIVCILLLFVLAAVRLVPARPPAVPSFLRDSFSFPNRYRTVFFVTLHCLIFQSLCLCYCIFVFLLKLSSTQKEYLLGTFFFILFHTSPLFFWL